MKSFNQQCRELLELAGALIDSIRGNYLTLGEVTYEFYMSDYINRCGTSCCAVGFDFLRDKHLNRLETKILRSDYHSLSDRIHAYAGEKYPDLPQIFLFHHEHENDVIRFAARVLYAVSEKNRARLDQKILEDFSYEDYPKNKRDMRRRLQTQINKLSAIS